MTVPLLQLPRTLTVDANGTPRSNAKLYVFAAQTTNPVQVWQDRGLTIPHPVPIRSNAEGTFPPIYADPDLGNLKINITDEDDVQIPGYPIDDIPAPFDFSQSAIGFITNPTTPQESAAGITPNNAYRAGSFLRYGMDPTGVTDSSAAFAKACSCNSHVFDDYPGGGTYLFNSIANVSNYPLRVSGSQMGKLGPGTGPGTVFVAGTGLGLSGACINFTSFSDVEVERIKFQLKASNGTLSLIGMKFAELRNSTIEKCSFYGTGTTSDDTTGILFSGTGTFTGGVTVDKCYFSNHQFGISCQGSITDLRVINSTFYGTAGHPSSIGLLIGTTTCNGLMVVANSFNLWNRCIFSRGSGIKQVGNRFENPTAPWEWVVGTATNHQSVGDTFIGGGVPIFSQSDSAGHQVVGAEAFFSGQNVQTTRSYQEGNGTSLRAFAMGYPQPVTFAAGNYTASGGGTWTVASGNVATFQWAIVGKTLTVWWSIAASTLTGASTTALQIAIPGGFTAAAAVQSPCTVENNAVFSSAGSATVAAAGTVIKIFLDAAGATNWTASANTGTSGSFTFPVN